MPHSPSPEVSTGRWGSNPGKQLFGYSVIVCAIAVAAILAITGFGLRILLCDLVMREAERDASALAGAVARCELRGVVIESSGHGVLCISDDEMPELDQHIRSFVSSFNIVKVKIFDTDTRIIYSTDPSIVGKTDRENAQLLRTLAGAMISKHESKETVWDLDDEQRFDVEIVETYVPIRNAKGDIVGAFEVYGDVTEDLAAAHAAFMSAVGLIVVTIVGVFGVLLLIIRRSTRIISARTEALLASREDLTDAKRQLVEVNESLEETVRQQTSDMRELLEQRMHFIRRLSHDLRTPLVPLVALLPMARAKIEDPELVEILDVSIDSTLYLQRLVERTLDFLRVEGGGGRSGRYRVDVCELLERVADAWSYEAEAKGIEITVSKESKPITNADGVALREIIDNLVANSVKYMPGKGKISLSACLDGDSVRISVGDNGAGMTPEQIEHAFQEFYKVDESRQDHMSMGLGLSICRELVNGFNGAIWIESAGAGQGTTVQVTVPSAESPVDTGAGNQWDSDGVTVAKGGVSA
ncbi:MAG: HAMP domain-containing sensor histidine kinase [Phycisphaerae bacterium]|jgi:signal transduction histidine kinase|nr:HAMP domain-containing sensor histidine kinase [Phycisphaerae bacterium]